METKQQIADALGQQAVYFHPTFDPLTQIILAFSDLDPEQQLAKSEKVKSWLDGA